MEIFRGRVFVRDFDYFCSENFSESLLEKIRIMNINEIVGSLKAGGLDASSTNRSAAVYVTEARSGRAEPGWFGFRIVCDSEATERRVRAILSRWYDIDASGNVWRLRSKNRVPLMAIKRGVVPPTPPTPTGDYIYFEAAEANSTVSMISELTTAPNLEYSTDGETWQEWQHTTDEDTHTFDTITLGSIGDRVYMRGSNPNGLADFDNQLGSSFLFSGKINAGGNIMSLLDKTMAMTVVPNAGFAMLFIAEEPDQTLISLPDMSNITSVGDMGFIGMYTNRAAITSAANMPSITTIGEDGCSNMYGGCTFAMSDDGTTLNFGFPTPPVTAGSTTYQTAYEIANWMGNTNGFTTT